MTSCPACWSPVLYKFCKGRYQCLECGCVFEVEDDEGEDDEDEDDDDY